MARRRAGSEQTLGDERALERWDGWLQRVGVGDVDIGGAAGQREHAVDLGPAAHEDQPAAVLPGAEAGVDDGVHAGTVHEGELAQVEHGEVRQLLRLPSLPDVDLSTVQAYERKHKKRKTILQKIESLRNARD